MAVGGWIYVYQTHRERDVARSSGAVLTHHFTRVAVTGSTNADLLSAIAWGNAWDDDRWLIADQQSAGKGRLGREWNGGSGNFMGSVTLALRASDPPAHSLGLVVATALHAALVAVGAPVTMKIKWPNDLLIDGAKLSGILLERSGNHVVIGVGINLALAPAIVGRKTASLNALGIAVDRDTVAESLAVHLADAVRDWRSGGWPDAVLARWQSAALPKGTALTLSEGEHAGLTGRFDGLERDGSLAMLLADGRRIIIHAGDVSLAD